jgi:Glucanosyltransferase
MLDTNIPIIVRGRFFYRGDDCLSVRGVVSQLQWASVQSNILAGENFNKISKHVELLKKLGANAILIYSTDPEVVRDRTMQLLADNGIYILVGLSTPKLSISRVTP